MSATNEAGTSPAATGKPDGLLAKHKLLRAVIDAPWATSLDHRVASHVIERYRSDHENSRAALRYLEKATGALRPNIIASLRRLVAHNVFSIARQGRGTRATEYDLNLNFARGIAGDTSTSGIVGDTSEVSQAIPLEGASGIAGDTESLLRHPVTQPGTVSSIDAPAVLPSVRSAPLAAPARDPSGPFQELWDAYGRKVDTVKARAAYAKLAPDAALHATMIEAAMAWAAQYATNGTEKKYIKHLHNWLAEERWLEELPDKYESPKDAAIARAKAGPRQAKEESGEPGASGLTDKTPWGHHTVEIIKCDEVTKTNNDVDLSLWFRIHGGEHDGEEFGHRFGLLNSGGMIGTGSVIHSAILNATGRARDDNSDLRGTVLLAVVSKGGRIKYAAADVPVAA